MMTRPSPGSTKEGNWVAMNWTGTKPPAELTTRIGSLPVGCSIAPGSASRDGGLDASGDAPSDSAGDPPGAAQAASAKSSTMRPGSVRFMGALTLARLARFRAFRARMEWMRRILSLTLLAGLLALPGVA